MLLVTIVTYACMAAPSFLADRESPEPENPDAP